MQKNNMFNFDYSYLSLPDKFYSLVKPSSFPAPEIFLFNDNLGNELNVSIESQDDFIASKSFAQSYAGHQFGYFTMLGDGRAIIKTGEPVYRETTHEGAALVRVMKSHIRVGTFEYAAHFGSTDDLKTLTSYTIKRLYPEIEQDENPAVSMLNKVMASQIELVANWMLKTKKNL